jgi:hypothetical protein
LEAIRERQRQRERETETERETERERISRTTGEEAEIVLICQRIMYRTTESSSNVPSVDCEHTEIEGENGRRDRRPGWMGRTTMTRKTVFARIALRMRRYNA